MRQIKPGRFAAQGNGVPTPPSQRLKRRRAIIPPALATLRETFLLRDLIVDSWSYLLAAATFRGAKLKL
jgi:hypothetical protein